MEKYNTYDFSKNVKIELKEDNMSKYINFYNDILNYKKLNTRNINISKIINENIKKEKIERKIIKKNIKRTVQFEIFENELENFNYLDRKIDNKNADNFKNNNSIVNNFF